MSDGKPYRLCVRLAYHHAEHYLGYTADVGSARARYQRHLSGIGSPLIRAALPAGHRVDLVWTRPGTRAEERRPGQIGGHAPPAVSSSPRRAPGAPAHTLRTGAKGDSA